MVLLLIRSAPATIVSADWSKHAAKRAVYVADVPTRSVRRETSSTWTLASLIALAARLPGPVLVGLDVALGLPASYLAAARASDAWRRSSARCSSSRPRLQAARRGRTPTTPPARST